MKIILKGTLTNVGDRDGCSGATIDLSDPSEKKEGLLGEGEFVEELLLELDLKKEHVSALAPHLYSEIRVTIEPIPKPKLVL